MVLTLPVSPRYRHHEAHAPAASHLAGVSEAIAADYPAVARTLGPGAFESLVARYLTTSPPRSFDLGRVGERLPEHLASDPVARFLPYLADLARLERQIGEAFVAPDVTPLRFEELPASNAAHTDVRLRPGAVIVRSAHPIHELWLGRGGAIAGRLDDRTSVVVYRDGLSVRSLPIDAAEVRLLERARHGTTLAALQREERGQDGALDVHERFRRLLGAGLFVRA